MRRLALIILILLTAACGSSARQAAVHVSDPRQSVDIKHLVPELSAYRHRQQKVWNAARWYGYFGTTTTSTTAAPHVEISTAASTSSHGPHSDAWWHGVSTCEQGGRNDPYFGYFSYMDGSAGGKSWSEQVAMGNATISRYGEDMNSGGAWAHACVMAGYAASPSG